MKVVTALAVVGGLVVGSGCGGMFSSERNAAREAGVQMNMVVTDLMIDPTMFPFNQQQRASAMAVGFSGNVVRTGFFRGAMTMAQAQTNTPMCAIQYEVLGVQTNTVGVQEALVSMRLVRISENALIPDPERLGMVTIDASEAALLGSQDALIRLDEQTDLTRLGEAFAEDVAWTFYHTTIAYAPQCSHVTETAFTAPESTGQLVEEETVVEEPAQEEPAEEAAPEEAPVVDVEVPAEDTDNSSSPFQDVE